MTLTFNDTTRNPLLVTSGGSLNAFKAVSVGDTSALNTTETVSVTLAASPYQYPTVTAFGSISDPNGGGTFDATTETFTESGLVGGDPDFATTLLSRLIYHAPTNLVNGQGAAFQAITAVSNSGVAANDTIFIDVVTPPAITGTVPSEPIASAGTIRPFATATLSDQSIYSYYGNASYIFSAKDTATITITDGGKATDADGLLTGPGLSKSGVGTYSIPNADYAYNIGNYLRQLSFATTTVAAGQTATAAFELDVTDVGSNLSSKDTTTSLLVIGPPPPKTVAPIIAGTQANQTVAPGYVIKPFGSVTISDANSTPTDVVAITLTDAAGAATDANGTFVPMAGLTETAAGSGIYTFAASDPATLTAELDRLTFVPAALASGQTAVATNFKIDVGNPTENRTATDTKTSVIVTQPTAPIVPGDIALVHDQTTGKVYQVSGEVYTGPIIGLTNDIILATPDNINVDAEVPNVFIHTGSGDDGLNVSAANGNNILDGSTGSNFLVGGTGNDTFYIDNRNPTAPIFSTIVNLHTGDSATAFGVNATDFKMLVLDNQGAAGFTGVDLIFTAPGHVDTSFVLAGYTSADLTNGRLSQSFGTTPDLPGLPGSQYLTIHAN